MTDGGRMGSVRSMGRVIPPRESGYTLLLGGAALGSKTIVQYHGQCKGSRAALALLKTLMNSEYSLKIVGSAWLPGL